MRKFLTLKNCWRFVLVGVALVLILFGSTAFEIYSQSQITTETSADAAIVLGASIYKDVPSPVFRERINHAVELYKSGAVKYLIFTGGFGEGEKSSESAVARNYAVTQGVPTERILIEEESRNTFQNLYFAQEILQLNNLETVLLVSDPLHMKRVMTMANDLQFENTFPSPTPTSRIMSLNNKLGFLFDESRLLLMYRMRKIIMHDFKTRELEFKRN